MLAFRPRLHGTSRTKLQDGPATVSLAAEAAGRLAHTQPRQLRLIAPETDYGQA